MYNGDSFGYIKKKPVTGGPYRFFDDPQYLGTTVVLLGYTVLNQSRIGYGLTGIIYLVFNMSVAFIEGPHMKRIYSDAKTAQKKKEKGKNNKDSKKNI